MRMAWALQSSGCCRCGLILDAPCVYQTNWRYRPDCCGEQKIVTPAAVPTTQRQLAQRANDRSLQLYKEKHYAAAESQFTAALKLRPDFALAVNNLGFLDYKQEKHPEAARWIENAIKMDPSRAIAHLNLGDARARGGEGEKKAY